MTSDIENVAVIILAAGKGTRMQSEKAKVLHELNAVPMIHYVVATAVAVAPDHVHVVVGHQADAVRRAVLNRFKTGFATQAEQLGTGHAVQCALPYLDEAIEHVVILCGDVPLLTADTVRSLLDLHIRERHDISVLAVHIDPPTGYGRIIINENGHLEGIVEEADADENQKRLTLINSGIYCVRKSVLDDTLGRLKANNAQKEFYLTDIIGIGFRKGLRLGVEIGDDAREVIGINTLAELKRAENLKTR